MDRLRQVLRRQHKALATEDCYLFWLRRYISALRKMPKDLSSEKKLERFLTELALRQNVAASTQNQAFNSVVFFYKEVLGQPLGNVDALRANRPVHERHAPPIPETRLLLQTIRNEGGYPTNLIARLLYGCGLRVTEPLNLRIKDVDLKASTLYVHQGKGNKGPVVLFPRCLAEPLDRQLVRARAVAAEDRARGIPVPLPDLLAKKYPWAERAERWAWLFPSHTTCRDPRSGKQVRWRCHENNVQRAVRAAACRCKLEGLTPHLLRHALATHALHPCRQPPRSFSPRPHRLQHSTTPSLHYPISP